MSAAATPPSLTSHASRNAIMAVAARVSTLAVGLILTPIVLHHLKAQLYGLVVVIGSLYDYLSLLRGGVGAAMQRYVTLHHHAGDHERARAYYASGFWLTAILRTVVLLAGLALAWPITGFLHLDPAVRPEAAVGVALQILAAIVTDLGIVLTVPIYVTGRLATTSRVQLVQGWIRLGMVFTAFALFGPRLPVYGAALVMTELVGMVTIAILAQRRGTVGAVIPPLRLGTPAVRGDLFRYGGFALLSQVAILMYVAADNLFIGRLFGPAAITHYSLGARWTPIVLGLIFALTSGLTPFFTMLEAQGRSERSRSALLRAIAVMTAVSVPLCFTPCVMGDLFLRRWVGPEYPDSHIYLIAMLAPAVVEGALSPVFMALTARGRIGWVATADIGVAVSNVAVSLILALGFHLGILGFALGNSFALVTKNLVMVVLARRRDPTFPSAGEVYRTMPRAMLGAAPGLALLGLLRPLYGGSLPGVMAAGMLGGALALTGSLLVALGPAEIGRLARALPGVGARMRSRTP
jgi:O-antigen/teichoic acid export membrane protein